MITLDFDSPEWRDEMVDELKFRLYASTNAHERRELLDLIHLLCDGKRKARARQEAKAA